MSTGKSIKQQVAVLLRQKHMTIAAAESVTAGLFQVALASLEEASRFFQGGLVAYNLGQKTRHLQIEPIHAEGVNCVSQRVADEMAMAACRHFSADWGIGITGYATAVPESGNRIFAYFSIAYRGKKVAGKKIGLQARGRAGVNTEYVEVNNTYVDTVFSALLPLLQQKRQVISRQ